MAIENYFTRKTYFDGTKAFELHMTKEYIKGLTAEQKELLESKYNVFKDGSCTVKRDVSTEEQYAVIKALCLQPKLNVAVRKYRKRKETPKKFVSKGNTSVAGEILNEVHNLTGIAKKDVARDLGLSSSNYVQNFSRDMRLTTFLRALDDLGYHIAGIEKGRSEYIRVGRKKVYWMEEEEEDEE